MAITSSSTSASAPAVPPSSCSPPYVSVKLDAENFLVWKKQILPLLRSQKLFQYIDPFVSPPSQHSLDPATNVIVPNPSYTHWEDVDQTLITFLQATFVPSLLAQTPTFSTSLELYQYLESSFASQVTARTHNLQTQLQQIQRGTQTITDYLAKIKSLSDALAHTPTPVPDAVLVQNTLRGLGSEYDQFVTAIETRETLPTFS
ncbi:hypothetical protein BVC80_1603g22 [Macleaya cordata]|uniref:Retrotransposon Copia-like N-terminal domain-containing protein n=1 Tax=Macleaya cordata TaxID=56857 RepID=A0A200QA21_MACCD|nr:hypothetical protein BVC80_1603g22 [Macleaya cordata]